MDSHISQGAATAAFERELEALILSSYARGARIEGNWTLQVPVTSVADWTVTIERHEPSTGPEWDGLR